MQSESPKVQQIIDWVLEHPGSLLPEIEKGTDVVGVASYLNYLTRNGRLVRTGDKQHYRYRVAEESDLLLMQSNGTHGEVMNNDAAGGREMMAPYICIVCPHCGKEAARLRFGKPEAEKLSAEDTVKAMPIDALGLSVRTSHCIDNLHPKPKTVGELIRHTQRSLSRGKKFGVRPLNELIQVLANMNLSLAQEPPCEQACDKLSGDATRASTAR
jgi:hypothetical protein